MTESKSTHTQAKQPKANGQTNRPQRVISDPKDVAQLVLVQIDNINAKKDDLTIAVKTLADTAKQLVRVYAQQQAQLAKMAKQIEELEQAKDK